MPRDPGAGADVGRFARRCAARDLTGHGPAFRSVPCRPGGSPAPAITVPLRAHHPDLDTDGCERERDDETTEDDKSDHGSSSFYR